jgi:hypothetical protein
MNANEIANEGIVTQLAVVHAMLPKVKELIDQQQAEIEVLKAEIMDWISDSPYNIIPDEYFKTILKKAQKK